MDFIHDIYLNAAREHIHRKFVKYGVGEFERESLFLKSGASVAVQGGVDYLDIVFFMLGEYAEQDVVLKGDVIASEPIGPALADFGVEPKAVRAKKYALEETMAPGKFRDFLEKFGHCHLLLSARSGKNSISTKKSLPQKGSLVEKFVSAKFDKKFYKAIRDDFLFDWEKDFREAEIHHTYLIDELVVDPALLARDASRARLEALRKGTIRRRKIVDGTESITDIPMCV